MEVVPFDVSFKTPCTAVIAGGTGMWLHDCMIAWLHDCMIAISKMKNLFMKWEIDMDGRPSKCDCMIVWLHDCMIAWLHDCIKNEKSF